MLTLTSKEITKLLSKWDLVRAYTPMPIDVVDSLIKETKTQILKSHRELDLLYFDRAVSVYGHFDVNSYSAVEIAFMTNLPISTILAFIERYGSDWQVKFKAKGFYELDREEYTLVSRFGSLTTIKCLSLIYGIKYEPIHKRWVKTGEVWYPDTGYSSFVCKGLPIRASMPFDDPRRAKPKEQKDEEKAA